MVRSRKRRRSGFTLLECVASLMIVGTSIIAGLSLFALHDQSYATQSDAYQALGYLQRDMERIRVIEWDALVTTDFAPVPEDATFALRRVVTTVDAVTTQVVVEIQWITDLGVLRTDSLTTLRCKGVVQ